MEANETPTAPVAGWTIAPVSALHAVMLRLDCLMSPMQGHEDAHTSRTYILTAPQAQELAEALQKHAALAQSGGPQGAGMPKH